MTRRSRIGARLRHDWARTRARRACPVTQTAGAGGRRPARQPARCAGRARRSPPGAAGALDLPTGLRLAIPEGFEVQIRPRSGLALKHGITLPNTPGTIDSDYRGPLGVIVMNLGDGAFRIDHGDADRADRRRAGRRRRASTWSERWTTSARGDGRLRLDRGS